MHVYPPSSEAKTTTQSRREQILPYCFSCECVSVSRETLCVCKIWYPLSSPELLFWDMCIWVEPGWIPAPTKASVLLLSAVGQGRQNVTKSSWVEIRTGRDQIIKYHHGQNRLKFGLLIEFVTNKIRTR